MFSGTRITHGKPRKVDGVSGEIQLAIVIWDAINRENGFDEGTITSLGDGVHTAKNSKHYGTYRLNKGKMGWWIDGVDFRTHYMFKNQIMSFADELRKRLGEGYQVIIESTHLHVEWDPK